MARVPEFLFGPGQRVGVDVAEHDLEAIAGETLCDALAKSACRSGDTATRPFRFSAMIRLLSRQGIQRRR